MDILHAFPHCHSLSLNSLPCLRVNLNTQLLSSPHLPLYTHACQKMCHLIAITLQDATATNGNRIWIWFVLWHHVDGQSSNTLYTYNLILKTEYLYFYRITETITGDNLDLKCGKKTACQEDVPNIKYFFHSVHIRAPTVGKSKMSFFFLQIIGNCYPFWLRHESHKPKNCETLANSI